MKERAEYEVHLVQAGGKSSVQYALIIPARSAAEAKREAKKEALRACLCGNPLATYRAVSCYNRTTNEVE